MDHDADRSRSPPGKDDQVQQALHAAQLSSARVLLRFLLRMIILLTLSAAGGQAFSATLTGLLVFAAVYCLCVGALKREVPFRPLLTNWDEAAAYAFILCLIHAMA
jgi:O-antigen/teichoic acid export membrane protein